MPMLSSEGAFGSPLVQALLVVALFALVFVGIAAAIVCKSDYERTARRASGFGVFAMTISIAAIGAAVWLSNSYT